MKLELKHIAPYYHYGLKVVCDGKQDRLCGLMFSDDTDYESTKETHHNINHPLANLETHTVEFEDIKPILRPLSYLKSHFDNYRSQIYSDFDFYIRCIKVGEMEFAEYEYLFEQHLDVFGLIEKGLAIDINTL